MPHWLWKPTTHPPNSVPSDTVTTIIAPSARTLIEKADLVVVRFGDKFKQWNAAFDAGYCAALGKPYVTLHAPDIVHALKEVDAEAQAWCTTTDQVVETLRYVLQK